MAEAVRAAVPQELVGREAETEVLDALIAGLGGGGGSLLMRGDPGIGKSVLLHHARALAVASGARALATAGVESEAELAFAGLHQLLHPILDLKAQLPAVPRQTLEAALGLGPELDLDPFRVAVAAFQLVCEGAEAAPLVLTVDDAQWLDQPSLAVLTFLARRLESEPVAMVAAVRSGRATPFDSAHIPTIELDRLSTAAAAALLDRNAPTLHSVQRARVLAEGAGNPLAIVELARVMTQSPASLAAEPVLTVRLERAFRSRVDDLPEITRAALLVAALDSRATPDEIARASQTPETALQPVVDAGLIRILGSQVDFEHPLIRSAVRQAATKEEVRAAYKNLAATVADPERRLWHRSAAATDRDEELSVALELHARTARARGAFTVAGVAMERAAALSAAASGRARRLVAAAEIAYELGLVDEVHRLLMEAQPRDLGPRDAARVAWFKQVVSGSVWFETGAARSFVSIAQHLRAGGDAEMALQSLVPIAHRCWWTQVRTRTREYIVEAAQGIGVPDGDPRVLAVVALAHPEAMGRAVLVHISHTKLHEVTDPAAAMNLGIAAEKAGDFQLGMTYLAQSIEGLRGQVRLGPLAQALVHFAWAATQAGDWQGAAAAAHEAAVLSIDTNQPQYGLTAELVAALAAAHRGTEGVEELLIEPERRLLATSGGALLATAHLARGAAALGEGRLEDAFGDLWPVFDETDPAFHRFMRWPALLDLVEAGIGSGQVERSARVIADMESIAKRSQPPILVIQVACAKPLLADDVDAEEAYTAALKQVNGYPFLRARTLFSYGRWLRRRRRSADSRLPLRDSIALFDAIGASQWDRRARQELRATGETVAHRTPEIRDHLTAQELQIAELAARGLSNRAIGERLFLSPRTVGGHLYRIFPKLHITARSQLREALKRVG